MYTKVISPRKAYSDINVSNNRKSRIDNPETLGTLGKYRTQDDDKQRKKKHHNTEN
jgi:hypothetical protein